MRFQAVFLLVGIAGACTRAVSGPLSANGAAGPVALVARRGDFEKRLLLTGEIDVASAVELKAPRLHAPKAPLRWLIEGESVEVEKGQKIAEIDNSTLATELREKELAVAQAEMEVQRQQWQNALAESDKQLDVERKHIALQRAEIDADVPPNILPKRDFLEKQLVLKRAQTEFERAKEGLSAQRKTAQMEIELRRLALDRVNREVHWARQSIAALTIHAPAAGLLLVGDHPEGRKYQIGDDVMMGVAIARMPDQSGLRMRALLSDVDDGRIATGMEARVTIDAYPELVFTGKVAEISPVAVEISDKSPRRVFRVAVDLDEIPEGALAGAPEDTLRPGLSARIEVIAARMSGKILVPRQALDFDSLPYRARLLDGRLIEIALGGCSATVCVAESGINEGTQLSKVAP